MYSYIATLKTNNYNVYASKAIAIYVASLEFPIEFNKAYNLLL